jgi:hypothetical protein
MVLRIFEKVNAKFISCRYLPGLEIWRIYILIITFAMEKDTTEGNDYRSLLLFKYG